MVLQSINPATERVEETFEEFSGSDIDSALEQAHEAQRRWRLTSFGERSAHLQSVARRLRAQKTRLAALATREMGKPIVEAEAEIEKCAWNCDFYADKAATFLADEHVDTGAIDSFVAFRPLGVVLAIMPWNFPFWQVMRFAAPALMAGNAAVLKHASNVPGCAMAIEEVFREAGLPEGVFRTVLIPGSGVEPLIADPRIAAVTLTGSSDVGQRVASAAGKQLKKQVLELGGSDPFIVLADADLEAAVKTAVRARNQNNGQSCIAAKRFIVEEPIAERFTARFADEVRGLRIGDPSERQTNIGPLARGDLRETLSDQVERSVSGGARLVIGGQPLNGSGYFYAPTVLESVSESMAAFQEETFGPVAAVIRARDPREAVRIANDTEYGLGAALWTRDIGLAKELARDIEAGNVFINGMVASDPRIPFGGIKHSGYGRELGVFGIREFVNIQTVVVGQPAAPPSRPAE
jgi:succinate-semialdehyde dehydrogenase/glutarate-semialdehyde dehydrogenase